MKSGKALVSSLKAYSLAACTLISVGHEIFIAKKRFDSLSFTNLVHRSCLPLVSSFFVITRMVY